MEKIIRFRETKGETNAPEKAAVRGRRPGAQAGSRIVKVPGKSGREPQWRVWPRRYNKTNVLICQGTCLASKASYGGAATKEGGVSPNLCKLTI